MCSTNLRFSGENTNVGFSVGYVLCARYVCTWYQLADHSMVPGTYVQYRATSPPQKNAAVLAADADAVVLVATMTPPYVRQKRLLAG